MPAHFLDRFRQLPARITFFYLVFGLGWILLSDRLLLMAGLSPEALSNLQTLKGWGFVGVSALLLFSLLHRETGRLAETKDALAESRALLKNVIEEITDPIFAKDLQGRYLLANPAVSRFTGIPPEKTVGRTDREIFPAEAAEAILADDRQLLAERRVLNLEEALSTTQGDIRLLQTTKGPLRDGTGRVFGLFGISRDITERNSLEEHLRRFKFTIDHAADAVFWITPEGGFSYVNEQACRTLGYRRPELLGQHLWDVDPEFPPEAFAAHWQEVSDRGRVIVETVHRRKDGSLFPVSVAVFHMEFGGEVNHVGFARDITDQKVAEEALAQSERRFRLLFQEMTSGFALHEILLDDRGAPRDYRFLAVNPALEKLTGLRAGNLVGKTVREVLPGLPRHWIERYGRVAMGEGPCEFEDFEPSLGRHFGVRAYSPAPGQFAVIFNDITVRKQAEEEIRELNRELEQRVAERTADLEARNRDLEIFSYSVSHDLRAPLRAVQGFADILAERHRERLDEEGRRYLNHVLTAASRMDRLIDSLLTYVRLGRKGVRRQPVPLNGILGPVAGELSEKVAAAGGRLEIPADLPVVQGDPSLLQQLFANLLGNAVQYHRPQETPRVAVDWERDGPEVVIRIRDHGLGIPAAYREKIFQPFQRLQSEEEFPGTGIGLAVVRKALELLGGGIEVAAAPGEGSVFSVRLPAVLGQEEETATDASEPSK